VEPEIMSNIEYSLQIFLTNNKIYKHFLKMNLRGSVIILEGLGLALEALFRMATYGCLSILYLPGYIGNDTSLQHVDEVAAWLCSSVMYASMDVLCIFVPDDKTTVSCFLSDSPGGGGG
ncbi:hypothetical protein ACJX0J_031911, partial [Zea mays]